MKNLSRKLEISLLTFSLMIFAGGQQALAGGLVEFDFDTADFSDSLNIDNMYWPLQAGTIYTYFAETEDGCEWNRLDVTYFTKVVDGVTTRVVLDTEWLDESDDCADELDNYPAGFPYGDMTEITNDWHAQDAYDNIWYLGEHTVDLDTEEEECDNWADPDTVFGLTGCLDGSFESGVDDAEAGIVILGSPFKGAFYQQEFYEDQAEDWGKVVNFVPVDDFDGCMKTKEWSPIEPGAVEHKYYCPDSGDGDLLLIVEISGGPKVFVDLIDVSHY